MRLTVAICTWNRAESLRRTLGALAEVELPPRVGWEVLVVNNACTDHTDRVLDDFSGRLPIRRLFEPIPGLSRARNRAVRGCRGDYILWTDDDVRVDPGWVAAYVECFRRHPSAAFFGGPIRPSFEEPPPEWLERSWPLVEDCYAVRSCPRDGGVITAEHLPCGANMALRADVQAGHAYDPSLGRCGDEPYAGEESGLLLRVLANGGTGRWVAGAGVRHLLPPERLTRAYLRKLLERHGKSGARLHRDPRWVHLFGRPWWAWRVAVASEARYRLHRLVSPPEVWVKHMKAACLHRGYLRAYRRFGGGDGGTGAGRGEAGMDGAAPAALQG